MLLQGQCDDALPCNYNEIRECVANIAIAISIEIVAVAVAVARHVVNFSTIYKSHATLTASSFSTYFFFSFSYSFSGQALLFSAAVGAYLCPPSATQLQLRL